MHCINIVNLIVHGFSQIVCVWTVYDDVMVEWLYHTHILVAHTLSCCPNRH